jgi:hypothetical protein
LTVPGEEPRDVTTSFSMSGAGASGGIVSTPLDLGRFLPRPSARGLLRSGAEARPTTLRPGRRVGPAGTGRELGRPGAVPLPHPLRHRLRPHWVVPRIRAVGRGEGGRSPLGHDPLNIPRRRARCSLASGGCRHPWCARCCGSSGAELGRAVIALWRC